MRRPWGCNLRTRGKGAARGLWNARAGVERLFVYQVPLPRNLPLSSRASDDP